MANTVIQLKYSSANAAPTTLNIGEPAYSYVSNTLFIGTPGSDGAIAIGGKFYLDKFEQAYDTANAAFAAANNASTANAAYNHANSAFDKANNEAGVNNTQNNNISSASSYANAAFETANNEAGVNLTQNNSISAAFDTANSAGSYANAAFDAANTADSKAVSAGNYANAAFIEANTACSVSFTVGTYANAAFTRANNSLNANSGGVVTGTITLFGDLDVSGNLVITGNTITQNVSSLNITDPLIYLAANNYVSDLVDIGFVGNYFDGANQRHAGLVRHAADGNFYLFYNYDEEPANNVININDASFVKGTLYSNLNADIATIGGVNIKTYVDNAFNAANTADDKATSAGSYANSAFAAANTADEKAVTSGSYANSAFGAANTADEKAVTAGDYANSAFITANAAFTAANNSTKANSAYDHANAAFDVANSAAAFANTDYTTISAPSGYYGNGATIASFTLEANGRVSQANSTLIGISASQVTIGILPVARGGTGVDTFTTNGVLLGQGASPLTTASSSTEGHVLTINQSGVPTFMHLSGGTF